MTIDTNMMISITEANQNFSKAAKVVDEHGTARFNHLVEKSCIRVFLHS